MKIGEIREKSDEELNQELVNLHREAFSLRMQQGSGQMARPSEMSVVRKSIARIKTVMNERRRAEAAQAD